MNNTLKYILLLVMLCFVTGAWTEGDPHEYTVKFNWSEDFESCTATVTCSCGEVYSDLVCDVTPSHDGVVWTYTATLSFNGEVYNDDIVKAELYANEDPDNLGNFYSTFYDRQHAYFIPNGVKAYTATISDGEVLLTPIDDGVIPKDEAVIIHGKSGRRINLVSSDSVKEKDMENMLSGSDGNADAYSICYILSYGQHGLGFYRYATGKTLAAHKAYLRYTPPLSAPALRAVFVGGYAE